MKNAIEIGIYGGTFSPIHYGHINSAKAFYEQCGLDILYIIPTSIPPHKLISSSDNPKYRLDMVRLAFENDLMYNKELFVSDYEIIKKGKSYTSETLEYYKSAYPNAHFTFLCGTDMFITLDSWHQAEVIFRLARIAYIKRGDTDVSEIEKKFREKYHAEIKEVIMESIDISSTELRNRIAVDQDVSNYIPLNVINYIKQNHLYGRI